MDKIQRLLVPKNKTWKDSLEYYNDFFKTDLSKYIDISHECRSYFELDENEPFVLENMDEYGFQNQYNQEELTSLTEIQEIEKTANLGLPKELIDLYTEYGSFSINDENGFKIFKPTSDKYIVYFIDQLSNYSYHEVFVEETDTLSDKEYQDITNRFFFWGIGFMDSDGGSALLCFYDREKQKFGEVPMLTERCSKMKDEIFPLLLAGNLSKYNLDELMCRQINRLILQILVNDDNQLVSFNQLEEYEKSLLIDDLNII